MRRFLLVALICAVPIVLAAVGPGKALAYGHADGPVAQVEVSGN